MIVKYHAVLYCQSTDINGLPTSVEIILTNGYTNKEVDRLYVEIEYPTGTEYSPIAKKMFVHKEGVIVVSPKEATNKILAFFNDKKSNNGCFRPIYHGSHSMKVFENLLIYTNFYKEFGDIFNSIHIDTMSYALLINTMVSNGSPDGTYPYVSMKTDTPSVTYESVSLTENINTGNGRASGILEIYTKMIDSLTDDFRTIYNMKTVPTKCPNCGANTVQENGCFLCGAGIKKPNKPVPPPPPAVKKAVPPPPMD